MRFPKISMIILLATLSLAGGEARGQAFEQVHLRDGSVVEGYICEQVPGRTISVQAQKAVFVASADSLESSSERQVRVVDLPSDWKKWVMAQPDTLQSLTLSTLRFKHSEFADVHVTESGPERRFISLANRVYTFPWSAVAKTVKLPREKDVVSGIEDVVVLTDGTRYVGQVVEQVPGKTMKVMTGDNNSTVIASGLIASLESKPMLDELSVLEQTPLLDRIYMKGQRNPKTGFITRRRAGRELTLLRLDGGEETLMLADIARYGKYKNPDYKVVKDMNLKKGAVAVNGDEGAAWFAPLKSENGYFILDEASMVAKRGDRIEVLANMENPSGAIYLIKAYRKVVPVEGSRRNLARDVFTYQDLVELAMPMERTETPLGNTKISFVVADAGDYILSIQGYKGFIVIHVD